jgi:hypothetical protein
MGGSRMRAMLARVMTCGSAGGWSGMFAHLHVLATFTGFS